MKPATVVVLFVSLLAHGVNAVTETTTYMPTTLLSGVTTLVVESEVEGTINWHSSSGDGVVIYVTKTAGEADSYDFNGISVQLTENPSTNTVTLMVGNRQNCEELNAAKPTFLAHYTLICICSLLTWLAFSRGYAHFLLLLVIFVLCIAFSVNARNECVEVSVDVEIHVPGNFTFAAVDLKSSIGSIEVDEEFIAMETTVACFSGTTKQECPSCCSGHGECINGECQCVIGYRNGTEDCSNRTELTFHLHINPADPVILDGITPDGDIISIIGERDENGTVLTMDQYQVIDSEGITHVLLEEGAPVAAMDSSGVNMTFDWSDDLTSMSMNITTSNDSIQISMNLTELFGKDSSKRQARSTHAQENGRDYELPKCSTNSVKMRSKRSTAQNFGETCHSVAGGLHVACEWYNELKSFLSTISLGYVKPRDVICTETLIASPAVTVACNKAFKYFEWYCDHIDVDVDDGTRADLICDYVEEIVDYAEKIG